jgi:hypothetical protein
MKIAVIPDVHGFHHWEIIIPIKDQFDKIVFLGDFVDSWTNKWPDQIENVYKIFKFKRDNPNKVDLLLGNHSTSYILNEHCSGYQPEHDIDINEAYRINKNLYEIVAIYDKWIFSHAGVSRKWMSAAGIKSPQEINQLFKERPNFFRWVGPDRYGRNDNEGPLWIRENLRDCNIKYYNQVVGHTELPSHSWPSTFIGTDKEILLYVDTKEHDKILILDTENDSYSQLIFNYGYK